MTASADSTFAPALHGPVTRAMRAIRTEPEPAPPRRGFLRALAGLPLIGGGLALIGAPTAVAEPVTDALFDAYVAWTAHEHRAALVEQSRRDVIRRNAELAAEGHAPRLGYADEVADRVRSHPHMFWFPEAPSVERAVAAAPPSTRAALVLSAVGCDWL